MPLSCFASSAPASHGRENGSCFQALFKACKPSRSASWGSEPIDEFEKNPNFKRISEEEFHKLYKVKKTIGVGGFSIVRKGKHLPSGEDVAIKVIDRSKYDPNDGSLEAEIVVLDKVPPSRSSKPCKVNEASRNVPYAKVQISYIKTYDGKHGGLGYKWHVQVHHPYCINFKECYFTRKHVYVITELVTGGELLDRVLKKGKYGEQRAAQIMRQLLEGVAYLHSIGVTHRDLKLENILLKSPDENAPIKIADFGLSKIFTGAGPLTTVCGSPQYVAPEVLEVGHKRQSYTPAADLWSIGVIMYILLSGYSPFDDANEAILFQKIKKGMFSMKQPVWESITYEGKDLLKKLLVTMPEKRLTAREALRHQWFKIMLVDNYIEDMPSNSEEVINEQFEQYFEAKNKVLEKMDHDEEVEGTSGNTQSNNMQGKEKLHQPLKLEPIIQESDEKPKNLKENQERDEKPKNSTENQEGDEKQKDLSENISTLLFGK